MRRNYNATPYVITAKWAGECSCCKAPIKAGDQAVYYPQSRKLNCMDCGRETLDALADERMMNNG